MYFSPQQSLTLTLAGAFTTTAPTYWSVYRWSAPQSIAGNLSTSATTVVPTVTNGVATTELDFLNVANVDTVACTVNVNLVTTTLNTLTNTYSTTTTLVGSFTIPAGQVLQYSLVGGWRSTSSSGQQVTSGTFPAGNVTLTGLLYETYGDNITAKAGGGQLSATLITNEINRLTTVATAGDSIQLPPAVPGLTIFVINHGAQAAQVYGNYAVGDTINDIATGTGVSQMVYSSVLYICTTAGKWYTEGLATGLTTSGAFQTLTFKDSITAFAGGGQASATLLTAAYNRITTVATAGDSVKLPVSQAGMQVVIDNKGANPHQVFGSGTDTINGIATGTGISQSINQIATFYCNVAGNWDVQFSQASQAGVGTLSVNGAIPPHTPHTWVITKAGVLTDTLAAPTATTDDGIVITVTSNTANAHTIQATGLLQTGTASVNLATFAAQPGAGLTLMAYQGKWNVLNSVGITFS